MMAARHSAATGGSTGFEGYTVAEAAVWSLLNLLARNAPPGGFAAVAAQ